MRKLKLTAAILTASIAISMFASAAWKKPQHLPV